MYRILVGQNIFLNSWLNSYSSRFISKINVGCLFFHDCLYLAIWIGNLSIHHFFLVFTFKSWTIVGPISNTMYELLAMKLTLSVTPCMCNFCSKPRLLHFVIQILYHDWLNGLIQLDLKKDMKNHPSQLKKKRAQDFLAIPMSQVLVHL